MRDNLSGDLTQLIRGMVMDGALASGQRINEVALAGHLAVSRTPLREALCRLTTEGFVVAMPRRGFRVQELRSTEAVQLYQVRATLDPAALALAGLPSAAQRRQLRTINGALRRTATDVEGLIDLDDQWHLTLLEHCPNRILLDLIRQFMQRTRPLERAYLRQHRHVRRMLGEHATIIAQLDRHALPQAVAALRRNMVSGIGPITAWLADTPPTLDQMRKQ